MGFFDGIASSIRNKADAVAGGAARAYFGTAEGAFRGLGLADAATNLRHYRGATGIQRDFTDEQIAKHLPITEAEDENRTRFATRTFIGQTNNNEELNVALLNLNDGETYTFEDDFKRGLEYGGAIKDRPIGSLQSGFGLPAYAAFGRVDIHSQGDFTATRKGNRLIITGTVRNGFDTEKNDNQYNFDPGQPGSIPAHILERRGQTNPYRLQFDRNQDVEAVSIYGSNGLLALNKVSWGPTY